METGCRIAARASVSHPKMCPTNLQAPDLAQRAAIGRCAQKAGTSLCTCLYTRNIHKRPVRAPNLVHYEGTSLYTCLCTHSIGKAGPFSVARLKMDLPFQNRLAHNRVHRRSALLVRPTR